MKTPHRFSCLLSSEPNPDYGQSEPQSDVEYAHAPSIPELARFASDYIARWNLGGGNWPETIVCEHGKPIGRLAYNGTIQPL